MTKHITSITLVGDQLDEAAITALRRLGEFTINAVATVEVVFTPPPVAPVDNFHLQSKGILGVRVLLNLIEKDGITLINDPKEKLLIRIYNGFVHISYKNRYATMLTGDFLRAYKPRAKRKAVNGIVSILNQENEKLMGKIWFVVPPKLAGQAMAMKFMNWDGSPPPAIAALMQTASHLHYRYQNKGSLGSKQFVQLIKQGVTHLNDKGQRFILISGNLVKIFSQMNGQYASLGLKDFMEAFDSAKGPNLKFRLPNILNNETLNWVTFPTATSLPEALELMRWNETLPNGG